MFQAMLKGWQGELKSKASYKLFLDSRHYHIFNNIYVNGKNGSTQIDHVIVSKYGIFVIETKNKGGWIFGNENDRQWTQIFRNRKKVSFQNPLRQNYSHTKSLADFLKVDHNKIFSMIVFWGDCQFKTAMPENVLKGSYKPPAYIISKKRILFSDSEVDSMCQQIRRLKENTSILQGIQHINSLKKRHSNS